jgi:hypothetical protein
MGHRVSGEQLMRDQGMDRKEIGRKDQGPGDPGFSHSPVLPFSHSMDPQSAAPQQASHGLVGRLISFSAHNRWLVIMLVAAAIAYAVYTMKNIRLDAIPDLSDTQVIVYTRWDRSPDILEDQVTYPIIAALLGAPKVKAIRGFSDFGFSYVYVIFQDGTDIYWARSRVVE